MLLSLGYPAMSDAEVARTAETLDSHGSGTCVYVAGCGGLWQVVAGCGRLWQVVAGCGRFWQVVAGCGGLWRAVALTQNQSQT